MSLNHKRRIFRTASSPGLGLALPARGIVLAFACGTAALAAAAWAVLQPSQAPARSPSVGYLAADPMQVGVVDGGTLRLQDRVVRLAGLDPPRRGDMCGPTGGPPVDCGAAAANALAAMVRDNPTECSLHGHDAAGRPLATCVSHGVDLNQALVAAGWAVADRHQPTLMQAEAEARAGRRGLWATSEQ